jgi:hypothetical protein
MTFHAWCLFTAQCCVDLFVESIWYKWMYAVYFRETISFDFILLKKNETTITSLNVCLFDNLWLNFIKGE